MAYEPKDIEKKWQAFWENEKIFKCKVDPQKPKYYVLDMFPYPSGAGLHVGHPLGYIATDIVARYKRMKGFNVLHPMGWDAFGLPAEQYAVQTGTHPAITTKNNIDNFRRQIKMLGFSYDWDREINTTDPKYYKWTQWIFLQLYNKGLAYEAEVPVNWCPELGTVLANEEVIDGKSERGEHPVFRIPMKQWMLKITDYAESLLKGLDDLDWPEHIKNLQRNWIGKSEGAEVSFKVKGSSYELSVFTTRPDTLFGATYMVLAPEHPLVNRLVTNDKKNEVDAYIKEASKKSDLDRTELSKEKTGVFIGSYAINPVNDKEIPIWISDYVIMGYGTGAIMAVPGQDQRDWEFAQKYKLPIIRTVDPPENFKGEAYLDDGPAINSQFLNGLYMSEAKIQMIEWLEKKHLGKRKIQYKLRDWLFSRQRYWGEPFPLIHTDNGVIPIEESNLPLQLPQVEKYEPSGTGESPLKNIKDWVEVKDDSGNLMGLRETNTMPQWAGSCWYYLRYTDPDNDIQSWDKENEKYWMPVDLYIGGAEHAVLHLLYSRFWHHVLFDLGYVSTKEPFKKLFNQGMILGEDGSKMSKSRGNVVNPDVTVEEYGADSMRLYEMFMGPLDKSKPWQTKGLQGCSRFLNKLWSLIIENDENLSPKIQDIPIPDKVNQKLHRLIKRVTDDLESLNFNTAVSEFMIFTNYLQTLELISREAIRIFIILLNPFVPHFSEEIWQRLNESDSLSYSPWPEYTEKYLKEESITMAIQINGKRRGEISCHAETSNKDVIKLAINSNKISKYLEGKEIIKKIIVPGRIVNLVVK